MCEYERNVLSQVVFGKAPTVAGAAWQQACEALIRNGMICGGQPTSAGLAALAVKGGA